MIHLSNKDYLTTFRICRFDPGKMKKKCNTVQVRKGVQTSMRECSVEALKGYHRPYIGQKFRFLFYQARARSARARRARALRALWLLLADSALTVQWGGGSFFLRKRT